MMKTWYLSKTRQEQRIILGVAGLLVLALFYLVVWTPLSESYQRNQMQLKSKRQLLGWMESTSRQIQQLSHKQKSSARTSKGPLLSIVDSTIKSFGLGNQMKRLEPQGNNKVQIWFENASFDLLIKWIASIAAEQRIQVSNINIDGQAETGKVTARVVLTGAGS